MVSRSKRTEIETKRWRSGEGRRRPSFLFRPLFSFPAAESLTVRTPKRTLKSPTTHATLKAIPLTATGCWESNLEDRPVRYKSLPLGLAKELKTKKAWHNHPHRGALCEKQEHEQLPLMTQGEESFGYCLRQLTEEEHSSQFLALKTLLEPKNNKKKRMKEKNKNKKMGQSGSSKGPKGLL